MSNHLLMKNIVKCYDTPTSITNQFNHHWFAFIDAASSADGSKSILPQPSVISNIRHDRVIIALNVEAKCQK